MKVNLIYDMRFGGSGLGGFTEERKEDAVITVLKSARHGDEFKTIVRELEKPTTPGRQKVIIDELLDFSQQTEYNDLKQRYK